MIPAIKAASKDPNGMRENYFAEAEQAFQFIDDIVETDQTFSQSVDAFMEKFRQIMQQAIGISAAVINGEKIKKDTFLHADMG